MIIPFMRLTPDARPPQQMTDGAAGFDLFATSEKYDYQSEIHTYGTGLAFEIPAGYVGLVFPRSSVYKVGMQLTNCVGVIDSDYRGEVSLKFYHRELGDGYLIGDRVGQLVVLPIPAVEFVERDELVSTARGTAGYGSTGGVSTQFK